MGVETEAGYTWTSGKNARLFHAGNKLVIKTITATADSGSTADLVDNGLTQDRWVPFSNLLSDPTDLSESTWTATNLTVGSDGLTLTETTDNGEHDVSQAYTWTAAEHVLAFKIERQTAPEVQVRANDGTTSFTCFFDLRDGSVGTAANCTGQIQDLGHNQYLLSIYFTPLAATGVAELLLSNGSETVSYAGATTTTIKVLRASANLSSASLRLDPFTSQAGTLFAVAAHNLGSSNARIKFEHDSDENDTWTTIGTVTPSNDSPIMFFFASVSSPRWRITVDRGALPEIGVVWVGDPLTFPQAFYAGFTPARMNRATDVIGNISRTGDLLGRSIKRTVLSEEYSWTHLTYTWVRANLDGTQGVIQSLEDAPAFLAWRPEEVSECSYIMRASVNPPSAMGIRAYWSFGFSAEIYAYE